MTKKFILAFAILALSIASAKTFDLKIFQPTTINGTELQAGDYRLNVDDASNKVVITNGKTKIEAEVKVENVETKYSSTSVRYADGKISEIRLGGTTKKLVLN